MAGTIFFSDLTDEGNREQRPTQPIWSMNLDDPDNDVELLKWLNAELTYVQNKSEPRLAKIQRNLTLYKGIQYRSQETRNDLRDRADDRSRLVEKVVVNNLADFTTNRVSRLVKYKPAVMFLPSNDEFSDSVAAKLVKMLNDHIWYLNRFESVVTPEVYRFMSVCGEGYLFIEWDPSLGDLHPDYAKLKGKNKKVPLPGSDGKPALDTDGNVIYLNKPIRTGDVKYSVVNPAEVFLQQGTQRWGDVEYLFRVRHAPVEWLRAQYPKKASKIEDSNGIEVYSYERMCLEPMRDHVFYYEFFHKSVDVMDEGRYIVFTNEAILHNDVLPYSHGELPCERITDLDLPGEIHGESFFERVKPLTNTYNNLFNLVLRNEILCAHPKWIYPAGSVKKEALGNDITTVEFKGPMAPVLASFNPTAPEIFGFMNTVKELAGQLAGVYGVSRGEPPPGIKAAVALQFLAEQESERYNEQVLKVNEWLQKVAMKTISVAGDYYDATDRRMIRVIGKDNQWRTIFFDVANLSKDYDVRVQQSSALPQSYAARTQTLLDLQERFPDRFSAEEVLDMLDLAQSEKFINSATVAIKLAEAENEEMGQGKATDKTLPQESEDHIAHWKVHQRVIQSWDYKHSMPPEVKEKFNDHVLMHEAFMMKKAQGNQNFAALLQGLPLFPMFFAYADETGEVSEQSSEPPSAPMQAGGEPAVMTPMAGEVAVDTQQEVNPQGAPSLEEQTATEPVNATVPPEQLSSKI